MSTSGLHLRRSSSEASKSVMTRDSIPEQPQETVIVVKVDDPENNLDMGVTHTHTHILI